MSTQPLDEALDAWRDARGLVQAEAENIPADQYSFRPTPEVRSVAQLLVHILEVSELMVGELCRPDGDFQRKPFPELIREYASHLQTLSTKQELLQVLRETLDTGVKQFQETGEAHLLQPIRQFDGSTARRLAWMHHGIAQEMYHGGQLALYTRMMGAVPALTQRIQGEV